MNIWYLSAYDQPKGKSSRTYDFSVELTKLGHNVTMFTNSYCHWTHTDRLKDGEKYRIEFIGDIRIVWLRTFPYTGNGISRGLNMLTNMKRSLKVARTLSDKPDVVIGPSVPLGTGWVAMKIAQIKGAAFVFEVRDVWPIALVDDGGLSIYHPIYFIFRFLEKLLYKNAHCISATMPFIYDHVAKSGSDPRKITWIPNGVNFERFTGLPEYIADNEKSPVVMYVGGFGVAHDVITIVRAAKLLQEEGNKDIRFVIVGNGVKRKECEKEALNCCLSNIEFRDPVEKSEVPKVQLESDILVACVTDSAAYRFGLNLNKVYDYFASGRPVIFAGKTPNDPIKASGAGYTIPPEDPIRMAEAIEKIRNMIPEDRVEMGRRGRRYVEDQFDMKNLGIRMEKLLRKSIEAKDF